MLAAERSHLETDLEAPPPARQRIDGDDPLPSRVRLRAQQCRAARNDGVEPAGRLQLRVGAVAEGIGEGGVGMDEIAMGENADGRRHRLEQRLEARRGSRRAFKAESARRRERARPAQHAAFHGAGDVLERLAVRLHSRCAMLCGIGHG